MITVRRSADRGRTRLAWLDSRHTFSFGDYVDPRHMGFGPLRVINEDWVEPSRGFGRHGHRDMEIITWVLEGALEHGDSLGTGSVIRPGEVQIMSAGTGIEHSEMNPSPADAVHLLQIWIQPQRRGLTPRYDQRALALPPGRLVPLATPDGRDGSVVLHQDASLLGARLGAGEAVTHALEPGRLGWLQVAGGTVRLNDVGLEAGDGAAVASEERLRVAAEAPAEVLLFDLPRGVPA